jgi:hypothetical protein
MGGRLRLYGIDCCKTCDVIGSKQHTRTAGLHAQCPLAAESFLACFQGAGGADGADGASAALQSQDHHEADGPKLAIKRGRSASTASVSTPVSPAAAAAASEAGTSAIPAVWQHRISIASSGGMYWPQ